MKIKKQALLLTKESTTHRRKQLPKSLYLAAGMIKGKKKQDALRKHIEKIRREW